jgi:putative salt-induced outer membrane protein YdiY
LRRTSLVILALSSFALPLAAQPAPAAESTAAWKLKLGFSYLATSGNTETSSAGFDAVFHHQRGAWAVEGNAAALSAAKRRRNTAESYNLQLRAKRRLGRKLKRAVQLTAGVRGERNRFAGIDARSVLDVSFAVPLVEKPSAKVTLLAGLSWSREEPRGPRTAKDSFGGLAQVGGEGKLTPTSSWNSEVTFFPSFEESKDYRVNGRLALQAVLNRHLALRLSCDVKYDHLPVKGFATTDTATTASLVVQVGNSGQQ